MSSQDGYRQEEVQEGEGAAEHVHQSEVKWLPDRGHLPQLPQQVLLGLVSVPGKQDPHEPSEVAHQKHCEIDQEKREGQDVLTADTVVDVETVVVKTGHAPAAEVAVAGFFGNDQLVNSPGT